MQAGVSRYEKDYTERREGSPQGLNGGEEVEAVLDSKETLADP